MRRHVLQATRITLTSAIGVEDGLGDHASLSPDYSVRMMEVGSERMSVGTCRNPGTVRDREPITFGGRHLLTHGGDLARGAE
jgi:hypothetical protein